jgi:hypothetical protein
MLHAIAKKETEEIPPGGVSAQTFSTHSPSVLLLLLLLLAVSG